MSVNIQTQFSLTIFTKMVGGVAMMESRVTHSLSRTVWGEG